MKRKKKIVIIVFALLILLMSTPITASAAIKLNTEKSTVTVGSTDTLKLNGTTKKVKWSTSNKKIATVTTSGKVKGIKVGNVTITATVGLKKYKCKVTVVEEKVNVIMTAYDLDDISLDNYLVKMNKMNDGIHYIKYDSTHYIMEMKQSKWSTLLKSIPILIHETTKEILNDTDYTGFVDNIEIDTMFQTIKLYMNMDAYDLDTWKTIAIYQQLSMISDYVQALNLTTPDTRTMNIIYIDSATGESIY